MRWLATAALLWVCATPAQAALNLCNRTSYILYAATSAVQNGRADTRGWTRITPGDCQIARTEPLTAQSYLVYARSSLAHSGPARAWGGHTQACAKDSDFHIQQAARTACNSDDSFALPFAPLDNHGHNDWTMNFDDQPALNSASAAQLAGVKRLLADNGYKVGPIVGKPDKATGTALSAFRTKMRFAATDGNDALFQALEREAAKKIAPTGYTVCNDGREAVMVALALSGAKPVSRGWWTVAAGTCAHTITTPLSSPAVYLLALRKNGSVLVGGKQMFCTTPAPFDIAGSDCAAHSGNLTGFAPTNTGGKTGYVAHIGPDGLK